MISDWVRKLRLPPDTFERHSVVAERSGRPASLLDVGGNRGELAMFMPGTEVVTINMHGEDADHHFDGDRLPFADDSFDVAVSVDVLEHIPAGQRRRHVEELARVARDRVVLCCPLGTLEHTAAEGELLRWFTDLTGAEHRFLAEHIERGLPTESELRGLLDCGRDGSILFHGDFRRANDAFRLSSELRQDPSPGKAVRYARRRFDPRRDLDLSATSAPYSNRAFLIFDVEDQGTVTT